MMIKRIRAKKTLAASFALGLALPAVVVAQASTPESGLGRGRHSAVERFAAETAAALGAGAETSNGALLDLRARAAGAESVREGLDPRTKAAVVDAFNAGKFIFDNAFLPPAPEGAEYVQFKIPGRSISAFVAVNIESSKPVFVVFKRETGRVILKNPYTDPIPLAGA